MCGMFLCGYLINWIGSLLRGTGQSRSQGQGQLRPCQARPLTYLISSVYTAAYEADVIVPTLRGGFPGPESLGHLLRVRRELSSYIVTNTTEKVQNLLLVHVLQTTTVRGHLRLPATSPSLSPNSFQPQAEMLLDKEESRMLAFAWAMVPAGL